MGPKYSRKDTWKKKYLLGPFYRFEIDSGSKLSRKFPFWFLSKYFFILLNLIFVFVYPKKLPIDGEILLKKNGLELLIKIIAPSLKDQLGESPSVNEYINSG